MEVLKCMIRQFYHVLLLFVCLIFVMQIFFGDGVEDERDIFTAASSIYDSMIEDEGLQCKGLTYLENEAASEVPQIIYSAGARRADTNLIFKSLLSVKKSNGTIVNGTLEDGFALYLMDIKTLEGVSVLEVLPTDEIENLEEIPASFIYDKETDRLYLYSGGVYLVQVKVYDNTGRQAVYEFRLPVEST